MDQKDYELRLNNSYISVNEDLGRAWFRKVRYEGRAIRMLVNEDYSTQNALNDTNHEYDSDTDPRKLSNSCRNIVKQM